MRIMLLLAFLFAISQSSCQCGAWCEDGLGGVGKCQANGECNIRSNTADCTGTVNECDGKLCGESCSNGGKCTMEGRCSTGMIMCPTCETLRTNAWCTDRIPIGEASRDLECAAMILHDNRCQFDTYDYVATMQRDSNSNTCKCLKAGKTCDFQSGSSTLKSCRLTYAGVEESVGVTPTCNHCGQWCSDGFSVGMCQRDGSTCNINSNYVSGGCCGVGGNPSVYCEATGECVESEADCVADNHGCVYPNDRYCAATDTCMSYNGLCPSCSGYQYGQYCKNRIELGDAATDGECALMASRDPRCDDDEVQIQRDYNSNVCKCRKRDETCDQYSGQSYISVCRFSYSVGSNEEAVTTKVSNHVFYGGVLLIGISVAFGIAYRSKQTQQDEKLLEYTQEI